MFSALLKCLPMLDGAEKHTQAAWVQNIHNDNISSEKNNSSAYISIQLKLNFSIQINWCTQ